MAMQALRIIVTHPDGRTEDFTLETERVMIGSGAHCEVRLPVDQAAPEHVLVQVIATGATVEARTHQPPPLLNGSPFSRSQLLPDSVIGIGHVRVQIWVLDLSASEHRAAEEKKQSISPITIVALILAIPAILVIVLYEKPPGRLGGSAPRAVPELWGAVITACPQSGQPEALAVAQRTYGLAQSRAERRPFRLKEGVAAVPLFEEAAACFEVAKQPEAAKYMRAQAEKLRGEISEDYRTHRAKMEHALDVEDYITVQKEVRVLLDMTSDQPGDYVTYLSNLDRQLSLRFGRTGAL